MNYERTVRVYRLVIAYPEGSDDPGWLPDVWEELLSAMPRKRRRQMQQRGFRWPRERMFLSSNAAWHRAGLLRWFGAEVEVQASQPVSWWEDTDAMSVWFDEFDEHEGAAPPPEADAPLPWSRPDADVLGDIQEVLRQHEAFYEAYFTKLQEDAR